MKTVFIVALLTSLACARSAETERISRRKCREYNELFKKNNICSDGGYSFVGAIGYEIRNKEIQWRCSGALISDQYVLTTALCASSVLNAKYVRLGEPEFNDNSNVKIYNIDEMISHPNYKPRNVHNNIALLKLEGRVDFRKFLQPACIHSGGDLTEYDAAGFSYWTRNFQRRDKAILVHEKTKVAPIDNCTGVYERGEYADYLQYLPDRVKSDTQFCHTPGDISCELGYGSVLLVKDTELSCMQNIAGLVELRGGYCDGKPWLNVKVSAFVDWIERVVQFVPTESNTPDTDPKPNEPVSIADTDESNKPVRADLDTEPKPNTNRFQGSQPCGVATIPLPLITHGQVTEVPQWPWHAALYSPKGSNLQFICSASLVTLKHVLTAAHCVTKQASSNPVGSDDVVVSLGKYHLWQFLEKHIQNVQVSTVTVHPEYNHSSFVNDIAILTLTGPVQYTEHVRPVCLWSEGSDINDIVNSVGTVVGWGKDHTGTFTETLMKASMPVVSLLMCIYSYPEFFGKFTNERTFCAGFRNGTSACNGDSGGGMVFPKYNPNPNQAVWQVRGIVSTSVSLQSQKVCDTSHYVVFTDVAKYSDWIKQNLV